MNNQQRLLNLFDYKDGALYWKTNGPRRTIGGIVGCNKEGRWFIHLDYKYYYRSRLIWVMHNGDIPDGLDIDHIDCDKLNDKIENLRLATRRQNIWNRPVMKKNPTGFKGVFKTKGGKYRAAIRINGKIKRLGTFETAEEAGNEYKKLALKHHGEFANC